jgi:hypothetical protein
VVRSIIRVQICRRKIERYHVEENKEGWNLLKRGEYLRGLFVMKVGYWKIRHDIIEGVFMANTSRVYSRVGNRGLLFIIRQGMTYGFRNYYTVGYSRGAQELESRSEIFTINPTVFKEVVRDIYILR